jgi:HD-GYP domain-containing protein (c-di-GMP phosphodiesterase class II)
MAKLIEALPSPFGRPACAPNASDRETIGSLLARRESSARFAAALESNTGETLRVWLDAMPGSTFAGLALIEQFDRWSAGLRGLERPAPAALRKLRGQLAAYRRPAPGILLLVDEIDAAIENLLHHLEGAAPLMAEHSRAVSAWCSRLGRFMNLSEAEISFVTRCGLIHDIGKMRTPPEILTAPRGLSNEEWAIMRDHAAEGGRIVDGVAQLRGLTPVVRAHHERLDGKGYPDGLRGSEIPMAARIVAVADSFNAMIGRRPYRLPMTPTAALDELERGRQTQFDPEIVEAMARIVLGRLAHTPTFKNGPSTP